jgi:hypothetical protein
MLVTVLLSHSGDGTAGATWPRCDVDAESCWRHYCQGMLATALLGDWGVVRCRCRVMLVTILPSHAGDGGAGATRPQHDVDSESC